MPPCCPCCPIPAPPIPAVRKSRHCAHPQVNVVRTPSQNTQSTCNENTQSGVDVPCCAHKCGSREPGPTIVQHTCACACTHACASVRASTSACTCVRVGERASQRRAYRQFRRPLDYFRCPFGCFRRPLDYVRMGLPDEPAPAGAFVESAMPMPILATAARHEHPGKRQRPENKRQESKRQAVHGCVRMRLHRMSLHPSGTCVSIACRSTLDATALGSGVAYDVACDACGISPRRILYTKLHSTNAQYSMRHDGNVSCYRMCSLTTQSKLRVHVHARACAQLSAFLGGNEGL